MLLRQQYTRTPKLQLNNCSGESVSASTSCGSKPLIPENIKSIYRQSTLSPTNSSSISSAGSSFTINQKQKHEQQQQQKQQLHPKHHSFHEFLVPQKQSTPTIQATTTSLHAMTSEVNYLYGKHMLNEAAECLVDFINEVEAGNQITGLLLTHSKQSHHHHPETLNLLKICLRTTAFFLNQTTTSSNTQQQQQQQQQQETKEESNTFKVISFTQNLFKIIDATSAHPENTTAQSFQSIKGQIDTYKRSFFSNLGIYSMKRYQYIAAFDYFSLALSDSADPAQSNELIIQRCIIQNNLAVVQAILGDEPLANETLKGSVSQSESLVFSQINAKKSNRSSLRQDPIFLQALTVLIYGYVFCHFTCKRQSKKTHDPQQSQSNNFLRNAFALAKKFLGEEHPLTIKVGAFLNQSPYLNDLEAILLETFPYQINPIRQKQDSLLYSIRKSSRPIQQSTKPKSEPATTPQTPVSSSISQHFQSSADAPLQIPQQPQLSSQSFTKQPPQTNEPTATTTIVKQQQQPVKINPPSEGTTVVTATITTTEAKTQDKNMKSLMEEITRLKEQVTSLDNEIQTIKQKELVPKLQNPNDTFISDISEDHHPLNQLLKPSSFQKESRLLTNRRKSLSQISPTLQQPKEPQPSPLKTPPLLLKPQARPSISTLPLPINTNDVQSPPFRRIGSIPPVSIFAASKNQDKTQNSSCTEDSHSQSSPSTQIQQPHHQQVDAPSFKQAQLPTTTTISKKQSHFPYSSAGGVPSGQHRIGQMNESVLTPIVNRKNPPLLNFHHSNNSPRPYAGYCIAKISEVIVKNLHVDSEFSLKKRITEFTMPKQAETPSPTSPTSKPNYIIQCKIRYNKFHSSYDIILTCEIDSQIEPFSTNPVIAEQVINIGIFTELLQYISFEDILPSTMNIDSITTLYEVCKFFILPFVGLQWKSEIPSLKVIPRASGIFSEFHATTFLNERVLVQVNYIEGSMLRIVICDADTTKKNLRIDYEFDDASFAKLFTVTEKDTYTSSHLTDYFDMTHASETSSLGFELVHRETLPTGMYEVFKRAKHPSTKSPVHFTQSIRIQDQQAFAQHFTHILSQIESIFLTNSTHTSFDSLSREKAHLRVRTYQGLKKSIFIIVDDNEATTTENTFMRFPPLTPDSRKLHEKSNNASIRILLFNTFDSFSSYGPTKIKEKGETLLTFAEIQRMYGVEYTKISAENQAIIRSLCSYHFNLRVLEKLVSNPQQSKSTGEPPQLSVNNILRVPAVSGGESTVLFPGTDGYIYPITCQVFGSKDIFHGIKVTLYDPASSTEQGIFLTTHHSSWVFQNEALKKKFLNFSVDSLPLSNYFICHIFKHLAVPVILSSIALENIISVQQQQQSNQESLLNSTFQVRSSTTSPAQNTFPPPPQYSYQKNPPILQGVKGLIKDNCRILRLETLLTPTTIISHFLPNHKQ